MKIKRQKLIKTFLLKNLEKNKLLNFLTKKKNFGKSNVTTRKELSLLTQLRKML